VRDPQGESTTWFYQFAIYATTLLLNVFSRWSVKGLEHVPPRGPLLVVANHQSSIDPPTVVGIMPRTVHTMAKQEIFDGPLATLARRYGSFPVRRGTADRQAITTALGYLKKGSAVVMFPEGTRSRSGQLLKAQPGAGLLALRSGAPILPVALVGTCQVKNVKTLLARQRIEIIIGQPAPLPTYDGLSKSDTLDAATDEIMGRLAALLPPEMRGAYASTVPSGPGHEVVAR
jgi:1-acyl-sn-glycerol-3-phosphate acyltransferase